MRSRRTGPAVPVGCQLEDGLSTAVPAWLSPAGRELAGDSTAGTGDSTAGTGQAGMKGTAGLGCPQEGHSTGRWAHEAVLNPCLFLIPLSPSLHFYLGLFPRSISFV